MSAFRRHRFVFAAAVALGAAALFTSHAFAQLVCCRSDGSCTLFTGDNCPEGSVLLFNCADCQPGACCASFAGCAPVLSPTQCPAGAAFVPGGVCSPQLCLAVGFGACCAPDLSCTFVQFASLCTAPNMFAAGATSCDPSPCSIAFGGVCCSPPGNCTLTTSAGCPVPENVFFALPGVTCVPGLCTPYFGACCQAGGVCAITSEAACTTPNIFLGLETTCSPNRCGLGGCCNATFGTCTFLYRVDCPAPNTHSIAGICLPNPCPQPTGACCRPGSVCTIDAANLCTSPSVFLGAGTQCQPHPCPPANDDCAGAIGFVGLGFDTLGTNNLANTTDFGPLSCGTFGSADVFYTFTPSLTCRFSLSLCQSPMVFDTALSVHTGCPGTPSNIIACGDDCDPAPSFQDLTVISSVELQGFVPYTIRVASTGPTPLFTGDFRLIVEALTGACCAPDSAECFTLAGGVCELFGGMYRGDGSVCTPGLCEPPCPADFNHSGTLTVQDIFDFLAAYFGHDPRADFNGVGGLSVQDIFDFLAAYFAGCA